MKSRQIFVFSITLFSLIFAVPSTAQMASKSQGGGGPIISPGNSPSPNLAGATQASLTFNLNGLILDSSGNANLPIVDGGSGSGSITYKTGSPSICSVSGNSVTAIVPGTCVINATKEASGVYGPANVQASFTITPISQAGLIFQIPAISPGVKSINLPNVSNGSGQGAVSYSVSPASCSIDSNNVLTATSAGTCSVTATKAASGIFLVSQVTANAVFTNQAQTALQIPTVSAFANKTATASVVGGSGSGVLNWSASPASVCTVDRLTGQVTAVSPGNCSLSVTKTADISGFYLSSTSPTKTLQIAYSDAPTPITISINPSTSTCGTTGVDVGLRVSGGNPASNFTLSCNPINGGERRCSVSGSGTRNLSGQAYWNSVPYSSSGGASNAIQFTVSDGTLSATASTNLECYK
jgi:hypothetical protein